MLASARTEQPSPALWWQEFRKTYPNFQTKPTDVLLQHLSLGIEAFRAEQFRKDPFLLKIWLVYLDLH